MPPIRRSKRISQRPYQPYVNKSGEIRGTELPQSCIEATETILRTHNNPNYKFPWFGKESDKDDRPPMILSLQNGLNIREVNVSDQEKEALYKSCEGMTSSLKDGFELHKLSPGKGVGFINNGGWDATEEEDNNMHFLDVLKTDQRSGRVTLSNISEPEEEEPSFTHLSDKGNTITVLTIGELRKALGGSYKKPNLVAGVVSLQSDLEPKERLVSPDSPDELSRQD